MPVYTIRKIKNGYIVVSQGEFKFNKPPKITEIYAKNKKEALSVLDKVLK